LGTDILYSGTASAARQGALKNLPSIALSLNQFEGDFAFDTISEYLAERLEYLVSLWDNSCFLNMNFPSDMKADAELQWCRPAFRDYRDEVVQVSAPRDDSSTYCFLKGNLVQSEEEEGTDVQAVLSGHAAISAVRVAPSIVSHIGKVPEKAGNCSR
ncbi:MAG: 5'/3'-nucleotidase SurE, partial [Spirochaetales bacterium]|nr:5'/3'-nucleotidase SurE [Spirochaetales bacterium]